MQIFPAKVRGLGFSVVRTAEFNTDVQSSPSKLDVRNQYTINPFRHWQFVYEFLKDNPIDLVAGLITTDLRIMEDFYLYHGGQAGEFLYLDPDDNGVGPAMNGSSPNSPMAKLQVVSDGAGTSYSPLQRTRGGLFYEDVTDLNTDTGAGGQALQVYANGVLQTEGTNYTFPGTTGLALPTGSFLGLYIKWLTTPTEPVTAQFSFYFRVRFETDEQGFEKFMNQWWCIGGDQSQAGSGNLRICTARPLAQ